MIQLRLIWTQLTWIQIRPSLNHRKKKKANPSRLILCKLTANVELLIASLRSRKAFNCQNHIATVWPTCLQDLYQLDCDYLCIKYIYAVMFCISYSVISNRHQGNWSLFPALPVNAQRCCLSSAFCAESHNVRCSDFTFKCIEDFVVYLSIINRIY